MGASSSLLQKDNNLERNPGINESLLSFYGFSFIPCQRMDGLKPALKCHVYMHTA